MCAVELSDRKKNSTDSASFTAIDHRHLPLLGYVKEISAAFSDLRRRFMRGYERF